MTRPACLPNQARGRFPSDTATAGEEATVADLVFVAIAVAFFVAAWYLADGFNRL